MKNRRKNKKDFSFAYILVLLAFVAGLTFLLLSIVMPPEKKDEAPLNTAVNETELKKKEKEIFEKKEEKNEEDENPDKTPKQNEDEPEPSKNELNVSITKNEVINGKYQLRVTIYEELREVGDCSLEMKSANGDYIKRTAKTINAGADSSSCEGFDISTEGIATGNYSFVLKITVGSRSNTLNGSIKI
ncbi:MAG: hypothetical protein K6A29_01670 [Lachnospiraceae bacterium]|nr:hypothetical protein [Lachnospiraceae bacterium]